jgi:hypothetical protein
VGKKGRVRCRIIMLKDKREKKSQRIEKKLENKKIENLIEN